MSSTSLVRTPSHSWNSSRVTGAVDCPTAAGVSWGALQATASSPPRPPTPPLTNRLLRVAIYLYPPGADKSAETALRRAARPEHSTGRHPPRKTGHRDPTQSARAARPAPNLHGLLPGPGAQTRAWAYSSAWGCWWVWA